MIKEMHVTIIVGAPFLPLAKALRRTMLHERYLLKMFNTQWTFRADLLRVTS